MKMKLLIKSTFFNSSIYALALLSLSCCAKAKRGLGVETDYLNSPEDVNRYFDDSINPLSGIYLPDMGKQAIPEFRSIYHYRKIRYLFSANYFPCPDVNPSQLIFSFIE